MVPFELLIGEIIGHPWYKDKNKLLNDTRKAFRMLKDYILNYKYGSLEHGDTINIRDLEVFGIIINGNFFFYYLQI